MQMPLKGATIFTFFTFSRFYNVPYLTSELRLSLRGQRFRGVRLKAEKRPQKFKEIEDSALITVYLSILCSLCEILESRKNKQDFKLLNVETQNFVYLLLCTFGLGAIHESRLFYMYEHCFQYLFAWFKVHYQRFT